MIFIKTIELFATNTNLIFFWSFLFPILFLLPFIQFHTSPLNTSMNTLFTSFACPYRTYKSIIRGNIRLVPLKPLKTIVEIIRHIRFSIIYHPTFINLTPLPTIDFTYSFNSEFSFSKAIIF